MRTKTLLLRAILALTGCLTIVSAALGQTVEERLATAEANVKAAQTAGDNAWMLASSALVLLMTGPGLALFYGGLVRKKNVLATMMQSFILMAVITVIWAIFGYSLSFAKGSPFIGGFDYLLMNGVGAAPSVYAGTIPHQTYMVFQLMFAIITPALITGKRLGFPKTQMAPHSLVISVIGACLLWVGWFGFNAGSAVNASGLASSAFVATHFGAASAVIGWLVIERIRQGKPTVLGGISGAVAGLVAITPASGFVTPMGALIIGFVAGVVCYLAVTSLKKALGYDDSLDAFGVHGVGGFTGAMLTGVFANRAVNIVYKDANGAPLPSGLIDGNPKQVLNQLIASLIAISLAVVGSFVILKIVDLIVGVRVTGEDEVTGLDLSQHGEEGYNLDLDVVSSSQPGVGYAEASFAAAASPVRE